MCQCKHKISGENSPFSISRPGPGIVNRKTVRKQERDSAEIHLGAQIEIENEHATQRVQIQKDIPEHSSILAIDEWSNILIGRCPSVRTPKGGREGELALKNLLSSSFARRRSHLLPRGLICPRIAPLNLSLSRARTRFEKMPWFLASRPVGARISIYVLYF